MKKFHISLVVGVLICMYILSAMVFPVIQIPFSLLPSDHIHVFNRIIESLAVSYLAGTFVYYLTVIRKNKDDRRRWRWNLYEISNQLEPLLGFAGERWEYFNDDRYKEMSPEAISKLIASYSDIIKKINLFDAILTKEESDYLEQMTMNLDFEPYCEFMDSKLVSCNVYRIKAISEAAAKMHNSIVKYIQSK